MSKTHQNKRWHTYLVFLSISALALIVDACRKIDYHQNERTKVDESARFFKVPVDADPIVKRLAAMMKIANSQSNFSDGISKEIGLPVWNKTIGIFKKNGTGKNNTENTDTLVMVPIATTQTDNDTWGVEEQVKGFFACVVREDSINIRLFKGNRYKTYGRTNRLDTMSAETVAMTCMFLDARTYPTHDTFDINDPYLFYDEHNPDSVTKYIIIDTTMSYPSGSGDRSSLMVSVLTQFCFPFQVQSRLRGFRNSSLSGGQTCVNLYHWVEYVDEGGPGLLTINVPSEGGGVTGSGMLNYNPNCSQFPGGVCGTPAIGWKPKTNVLPFGFNPYIYDTVGITNALRDYYPCAYAFINDSLPNANFLAQLAGGSVFKDSAYMHLTFDTSTLYTQSTQLPAETSSGMVLVNSEGITEFHAVIGLNGWHLRNSTKEFMIATIIHETMHAIFNLRWGQYLKWLQFGPPNEIDSTWIKDHYPIYWNNYVINGIPSGQVNHHQIMATDYLNQYKEILKIFWNPAAPTAIRDSVINAMCFGGLYKTTAWKLLASQGIDTCRYKAMDECAGFSHTGTYTPQGCATYGLHYADSLKLRPSCN